MRRKFIIAICLLLFSSTVMAAGSENILSDNYANEKPIAMPFLTAEMSGIITDTSDYAPGDSVIISGGGFLAGETVEIDVTNVYNPGFGDNGTPWYVTADANGNIETYWIVPNDGVDQTYLVTADGLTSGIHTEVIFTDANTILVLSVAPFDTTCAGTEIDVCGYLTENCGGGTYAPLENRPILFFLNSGNCGNDVAVNADDTVWTDENGLACATLTAPGAPGTYTIRIKFVGEDKPGAGGSPNSACDPSKKVKLSASNECEEFTVVPLNSGNAPIVTINDTTVVQCSTGEICLPVLVEDNECDIDTIYSNLGQYSGTQSGFDQISRLSQLGGTITQVGGGAPGTILTSASDFVAPLNSLSGVSVTLPSFIFASSVTDYGSFPSGVGPAQSADQLTGSPTDLTFTLAGAGGPDGGSGDGSVDFATGNYVSLGFSQLVTVCDGSSVDVVIFTNTAGSGDAKLLFKNGGNPVHSMTEYISGGTAGSGDGGITIDVADGIMFDEIEISCLSGSIEVDAIAARILPSVSASDICFTADTAGVYTVIVTASDKCLNIGADTAYVTVSLGNAPVANAGSDLVQNLCSLAEVCFGVSFSDADNDLALTELTSGTGTLTGNQICFTPASAGDYTFIIHALDSCGSEDYDTVVVTINANNAPVAVQPDSVVQFLCSSVQICNALSASDVDGDSLTWSLISGVGAVSNDGNFCFTPGASGIYEALVAVADPCGNADTVSLYYNITINSAPIAVDPSTPMDRFLCLSEEICYQFGSSDVDGGTLSWTMLVGSAGTISTSGNWCFTPVVNGSYSISAVVTDSCGLADTTTKTFNVIINDAPLMTLGADTAVSLCLSEQVCLDYVVSDNQGMAGLSEVMLSGFGTLDTLNNQICFVPASAGSYQFIMEVTDSCGATSVDTINVDVTLGESASISCPTDTIDINLCAADNVCQLIGVSPGSATVSSSLGTYSAGELCFYADTSGIYTATMIADETCGSDTCEVVFNVVIGSAAQISCPAPQNIFICESDSICIPIGINGSGVVVTVSPIGTYQAGNICFVADTSGHYEISVIAVTDCGADSCIVEVDVTLNSAPVAVDPGAAIDTFLCDNQALCYQFVANDIDGAMTWSKLSGVGTVSSSGQFCFTSSGAGSYSATAVVSDSCGASDTVSITYNVTLNSAPTITLANDTTVFLCVSQSVCVPYLTSDIDNNIDNITLLVGSGVVDTMNSNICFYPLTPGSYQFVAQVTDDCGLTAVDTVNITVALNNAPTVDAGADLNLFQCVPTEFCQTITSNDIDGNIALFEMIEGVGTFIGGELCFTPDTSFCYEFIFRAVDDCGLEGFDTLIVCVELNNAPIADAGSDQTLFQCTPTEICVVASCSDIDGNLATSNLTTAVGSYNGSSICFTPDTSGLYTFILQATDDCGLSDADTVLVDVTINSVPVCSVPSDTIISQCTLAEVCLPLSGSDVDGNLAYCQIISGPGTITGGNWCYTPTSSQVISVTVECVDSCNAVCQSTFNVEFKINQAPTITFESPTPLFFCEPTETCIGYSIEDPNAPQNQTESLLSGFGYLDAPNNQVCFTPDTSGSYTFIVSATDDCGAYTVDTVVVEITLNSAPTVAMESDQTFELCDSQEICLNASVVDTDNNLTGFNFSGPGIYDGSTICFTPASSGDYQFILDGTDACGITTTDTLTITIILNNAPMIAFNSVNNAQLCVPTLLCIDYSVSDLDGLIGMTEQMVSGYGSIDTLNNQICFTPTTAGSYQFIIGSTDSCGASAYDTVSMQVDFGESVAISCPTDTIDISLCAADVVCQMIDVQPSTATVTPSFGTYLNGELCFNADTAGLYAITLIADESCGSDTCEVYFNVSIGSGAQISCPASDSLFICQPDSVCIPVGINGTGVTVTVLPFGTYVSGNICFPADTSGHYEISVIADASCGSDSCVVVVDVVINDAPVVVEPASPVDTFICSSTQICYQFDVTDANGDTLGWSRISGDGTVSYQGLWCFNATTNNNYSVTAVVTDACAGMDTVSMTYNISLNVDPVITLGNDTTYQLCTGQQFCFDYNVSDPNLNIETETLLTSFGTLDTVANNLCFTTDTAGVYLFVVEVTDGCGETDIDSLQITIGFNNAPVADIGADNSLFLCDNSEICWDVSCTDIDNNLDTCYLTSSIGTYTNSAICFTPDTAGVYTFILRAVDDCGLTDEDTVQITVDINSSPICGFGGVYDKYFQCAPQEISIPTHVVDVDNNFDHCEILSGPGSIIDSNWVFTPTASDSFWVKIMCIDSCGSACIDSFKIEIELNAPPIVSGGVDFTQFLCAPEEICFPITYSNLNLNLPNATIELLSNVGTVDLVNEQVCFTPTSSNDQTYTFILHAVDACGAEGFDTVKVHVDFNEAPTLDVPPSFVVYLDDVGDVCFDVSSADADSNLTTISVNPLGSYNQSTDEVCFTADTSGEYCFEITATDDCGLSATQNVCVTIQIDECFLLQIDKTHATLQGQYETVKIYYDGSTKEIGGFDISIGYDQSALTVGDVRPGELFTDCGWEYFTYRYGPDGNCPTGCPSGVLRIIGIAETNNGGYHPDCFLTSVTGDLVQVDFLVSNDRTLECQYAPIKFFWFDCGDNTLSSRLGDTLWMSRDVFGFEGDLMTNNSYGFPGYYGAEDFCMIGGEAPGKMPIRCVDFTNGGIDIVCADSIDAVGDINLNEISYEIADAVLYSNYFVYGLSVFTMNAPGQVAASDVNKDGLTLSVADLVYLIRVIVGDALPYAKLVPEEQATTEFTIQNGELVITDTDDKIGALSLLIEGDAKPILTGEAANMDIKYNFDGEFTRVIVYSIDGKSSLSSGQVLKLNGNSKITEIDVGSQSGYVMHAKLNSLPDSYELKQNYPNPFNPTTIINFGLPTDSEWELVIFNVLGQKVETFGDNSEAGFIEIEWDASKYASGVYFYRLRAGDFSDTKKMVLLK